MSRKKSKSSAKTPAKKLKNTNSNTRMWLFLMVVTLVVLLVVFYLQKVKTTTHNPSNSELWNKISSNFERRSSEKNISENNSQVNSEKITTPNIKNGIFTSADNTYQLSIPTKWHFESYFANPMLYTKPDGLEGKFYNEDFTLTNNDKSYLLSFSNADGPAWSCGFVGEVKDDGRPHLTFLNHYSYIETNFDKRLRIGTYTSESKPDRIFFLFCDQNSDYGKGYYDARVIGFTAPGIDAPKNFDKNIINELIDIVKTARLLK